MPFGIVEAVWSLVAVKRWSTRAIDVPNDPNDPNVSAID
jgi:hypothetical protein